MKTSITPGAGGGKHQRSGKEEKEAIYRKSSKWRQLQKLDK